MNSILELQRALLANNVNDVSAFFSEANRRTGNQAMITAAEEFGFKTSEIYGYIVTTGKEIAGLMGHKSDSTVRKMRETYNLTALFPLTSGVEFTKLRQDLGLHTNDGRTALLWWDTFLVCAIKGRTDASDVMLQYVLDMEKAARVFGDGEARAMMIQKQKQSREMIQIMKELAKMPDTEATQFIRAEIEAAYDVILPPQSELSSQKALDI